MSLTVSTSFSHTSPSSLATSLACSFQLSPLASCHSVPASPVHCAPPQPSSADYRSAPLTPQRPCLSTSSTYFSSTSTTVSSSTVYSSSPRSPSPARPASAPSPSLHRSRSPVTQMSLAFSSSTPLLHPVPAHHSCLHRSCITDTSVSSPPRAAHSLRSSTACRPTAASSSPSCHAAFDCVRVQVLKRYSDHSEYNGSARTHIQTWLARRRHCRWRCRRSLTSALNYSLCMFLCTVRCVAAPAYATGTVCSSTDTATDTADSGRSTRGQTIVAELHCFPSLSPRLCCSFAANCILTGR